MPRGGHNRKPAALKLVQGTARKDREPENEPEVPALSQIPKPPSGFNRWARKVWKDLSPYLVDTGVLTPVDLPAWEACCQQYGIYRELLDAITHYDTIDAQGKAKRMKQSIAVYLAGRNSQTIPEYTAMRQAFAQFKTYAEQFGITPASRNRIDLKKGGEETIDPMEQLLNEA